MKLRYPVITYFLPGLSLTCTIILRNTGQVIISLPILISDGILALGNNSVTMIIGRLRESLVASNVITAVAQQQSLVVIQGVAFLGAGYLVRGCLCRDLSGSCRFGDGDSGRTIEINVFFILCLW